MKQENKLLQYSSLAVSFLFLNEGNAQVMYTDIDPDIEIQFDSEIAIVDIDNNGVLDFKLWKTSGTYYYFDTIDASYYYRSRRAIGAGPVEPYENEIAGDFHTNGAGGGTTYLPYKLNYGSMIDNLLSFQSADVQVLVIGHRRLDIGTTWNDDIGEWMFLTENKYVGVRFIGEDKCRHYGWIRCTIAEDVSKLIIQGYAYELKCETGILAGDTIGDTTTAIEEINSLNANVYSYNKSIFINLNEFMSSVEIHIYDLNGKMIYSGEIVNQSTQIELNEAKGVYFVELINGEKKFRKKVYLN